MANNVDQIFVIVKHWLVGLFPQNIQWFVSILLSITPILVFFPLLFAVATWLERKGLGRIQNRLGPNRVGPFGLLQPIADGLKMLTKEDLVPTPQTRSCIYWARSSLLCRCSSPSQSCRLGGIWRQLIWMRAFSSFLRLGQRPNWPCLWPVGRAEISIHSWAPCARSRR